MLCAHGEQVDRSMRIYTKKRRPGQIEFGIIYGVIVLLMLAAGRFLPVTAFLPACVFKGLTGIPCLTCGSTRSLEHLSQGHLMESLSMNPLISLTVIVVLLSCVYSLITLLFGIPRAGFIFSEGEKGLVRAGAFVLLLANWLYLAITL